MVKGCKIQLATCRSDLLPQPLWRRVYPSSTQLWAGLYSTLFFQCMKQYNWIHFDKCNEQQASEMLAKDPSGFHDTVQESLRRWKNLVHHIKVKWNHFEKKQRKEKKRKRMNQIESSFDFQACCSNKHAGRRRYVNVLTYLYHIIMLIVLFVLEVLERPWAYYQRGIHSKLLDWQMYSLPFPWRFRWPSPKTLTQCIEINCTKKITVSNCVLKT